jgi:hypothetical protein
MAGTPKVPRGCFGIRDWNGDLLIFDPKAPITPGCRVLVYLRDDLRVRFVATFIHEFAEHGTIRLRIDRPEEAGAIAEFDRNIIDIATVVRIDRDYEQDHTAPASNHKP